MSQNEQPIEWYLARDGKQFGPVSDLEMTKLVELGHLRAADLVWRQGFAQWTEAGQVFPALQARAAPPAPQPAAQPSAPQPVAARPAVAAPTSPDPHSTQSPRGPQPSAPEREAMPTAPTVDARPQNRPVHANQPAPQQPFAPQPGSQAPVRPAQGGPAGGPHVGGPGAQPRNGAAPHPQSPQFQGQPPQGHPAAGAPTPSRPQPRPAGPTAAPAPAPQGGRQLATPARGDIDDFAEPEPPRRRGRLLKVAAGLVMLLGIGGGLYALHASGNLPIALPFKSAGPSDGVPVVRAPTSNAKEPPLNGFADTPAEVDAGLQKAALWQLLKREFPDWYGERVAETTRLRAEKKDDAAIAATLTRALVELRRKNAESALSASPERLRFVAASFVENLGRLSKHSTEACYGFISQGESSPVVIELMRSAEHTASLQGQFTAIFQAVADGRKSPKPRAAPKREDYDVLAAQLAVRGWSPADLQTFSDARALSRAKPERVCQMVQDWFAAQLAVKDEAVQSRLLVEALKPVVAG